MPVVRVTTAVSALLCVLSGCSGPAPGAEDVAGTTRAAAFQSCPRFEIGGLTPSFAPVERSLPNLGGNLLGRIERWSDGSATLTFYAGYDVFDRMEDLDFLQRTVTTGTRAYLVHETAVDPELRAVSWAEAALTSPCAEVTVVATRLGEVELLRVADSTRIRAS